MKNITEAVKSSARAGQSPETRILSAEAQFPYGKLVRQGDIMLKRHPLGTDLGTGADAPRKLAPGAEIGSRHIVRPGPAVLLRLRATELQGPIIVAPTGFYLEHPKHADFDVRLPGVYEVTFQQDLSAEGLRRIRD